MMIYKQTERQSFLFLLLICYLGNPIVGTSMMQENTRCIFKKLTCDDISLMQSWLKQPHVIAWWPAPKDEQNIIAFLEGTRENVSPYLVLLDTQPIGYVQSYTPSNYVSGSDKIFDWLPPLPQKTLGIDQFIGDQNCIGKGYGTRMIQDFIKYLHSIDSDVTAIIVDPEPINYAAIKCYEKVGFKSMGTYAVPWGLAFLMKYDL